MSEKSSIWHRLYHGETAFNFVGRKRTWFIASGVVILIGAISLVAQGLNFGIDFEGGTAWEVKAPALSVRDARDAIRPEGLGDAKVQQLGGDTIRVQSDVSGSADERSAKREAVSAALAKVAKVDVDTVSVNEVGPSWGGEVTSKAERALVFFFLAITLYITLRFEWKMALAALAAVVHDIAITVGVYSLSGFEVTPATVIAFLTILGYSLYDTIVVFDKVEENTKGLAASGRMTYGDTVNLSMNQVLMRSLNTSLVAILPILSVLIVGAFILGATTLEDFGLALLIGLLTGAYSSIFIAAPILAILKEREPRYASIKQRILAKGAVTPLTPAAAAAGGVTMGAPVVTGAGASRDGDKVAAGTAGRIPPRPGGTRPPPRPRKKGKKR
ncbi:MAG TPA: protein translocase subunit SecF [Acidimicrobiales bacterium]|nr:protein translocase subunit SecF [Acidimicrobiales bacterium]